MFRCLAWAWDQGCIIDFARQQPAFLPPGGAAQLAHEWHYKPHEAWRAGAPPVKILHLHGPKPDMLLSVALHRVAARGGPAPIPGAYEAFLSERNIAAYLKALALFLQYADADVAPLRHDAVMGAFETRAGAPL